MEHRDLISTGDVNIMNMITLLTQASTQAAAQSTTQHLEVMSALGAFQNSLNSTGSATATASSSSNLLDVEMQPVDVCMICHDDSPDGPPMPCCYQGNHRACKFWP